MQWLSGRVLDSRPRDRGFEPHGRYCVVSLSKNNPSLVLVQLRKNRPFITERFLMGRKESNQTHNMLLHDLCPHIPIQNSEDCCLLVGWFSCFTSQVNSYGHCETVSSPTHTFSWAGLNKRLTSNLCTYFRL